MLAQFWMRLAASAGMPVSMLMGQVQGGLGDASKGDIVFFYDRIAGRQEDELLPQVERLTKLQLLAKTGPTKGILPRRWSVTMNPLREMSDPERASYRKTIADTDIAYINAGVVTPEEVAAKRFGGSDYDDGPIVLDLEGRKAMAADDDEPPPEDSEEPSPEPKAPTSAPVTDSADFIVRGGRTKIRSHVTRVAAFNSQGQLLLGQRRDSGRWTSPGGHLEPGETPLAGAMRELHEETGLRPLAIEPLGTRTVTRGPKQVRLHLFRATVRDAEPSNAGDPDSEFGAFRWVETSRRLPPDMEPHYQPDALLEALGIRWKPGAPPDPKGDAAPANRGDAGEWNEEDHPRAPNGEFGSGPRATARVTTKSPPLSKTPIGSPTPHEQLKPEHQQLVKDFGGNVEIHDYGDPTTHQALESLRFVHPDHIAKLRKYGLKKVVVCGNREITDLPDLQGKKGLTLQGSSLKYEDAAGLTEEHCCYVTGQSSSVMAGVALHELGHEAAIVLKMEGQPEVMTALDRHERLMRLKHPLAEIHPDVPNDPVAVAARMGAANELIADAVGIHFKKGTKGVAKAYGLDLAKFVYLTLRDS